jgi:hypothetical protein
MFTRDVSCMLQRSNSDVKSGAFASSMWMEWKLCHRWQT